MGMFEFQYSKKQEFENCVIYLVDSRKNRPINQSSCALCKAISSEAPIIYRMSFVLKAKYPSINGSQLFVSKDCNSFPNEGVLKDLIYYLEENQMKLAFSNMLNKPSIELHWHADICDRFDLPNYFTDFWLDKVIGNKKYSTNDLNFLENKYGNFYFYILEGKSIKEKFEIINNLYKYLSSNKIKVHLAISNDIVIFTIMKDFPKEVSISAKSIFGHYTASTIERFEYMNKLGISNMLKLFTVNQPLPHL